MGPSQAQPALATQPQSLTQVRALLDQVDSSPVHALGQNFLIDPRLMLAVAAAGELTAGDVVLEVGPGTGSLTALLLGGVGPTGRVLAVEADRRLHGLLSQMHAGDARLTLTLADALATLPAVQAQAQALGAAAGRAVKLVANLPYQIASPLVVELLLATPAFGLLAFTVQREVADRLAAGPGDPGHGPLGVIAQALCASVEPLQVLPRQAFWPAPQVSSQLVRLRPLSSVARVERLGPAWADLPLLVRHLFGYRRKTLSRTLRELPGREDLPHAGWCGSVQSALEQVGLDLSRRAETLTQQEVVAICRALPAPLAKG